MSLSSESSTSALPDSSTYTMEKLPLHSGDEHSGSAEPSWATSRPRPSRATLLRRVFIAVCFFLGYYMLIRPSPTKCTLPESAPCDTPGCTSSKVLTHSYPPTSPDQLREEHDKHPQMGQRPLRDSPKLAETKIALEAHIMSKCPDAQDCLHDLILPAMEQISDKVDFKLSFIASPSKESSDIECKHGPAECIGDMLMLCAANLPFPPTSDDSLLPQAYPRTPIIRSLGFANCLISDFQRIPERGFVHQCALEHGIDFDALNSCASQQNDDPGDGGPGRPPISGLALLRDSALRSERVGAKISCTVRLDESVWCIRDNGEWKDCVQDGDGSKPQVLIDGVKRLWGERN